MCVRALLYTAPGDPKNGGGGPLPLLSLSSLIHSAKGIRARDAVRADHGESHLNGGRPGNRSVPVWRRCRSVAVWRKHHVVRDG